MQALDLLLRSAGAFTFLATAALLLRGARREPVAWYFLLLALCICGFLARNSPDPALLPGGPASPLANLLSGHAAIALWWFCLALFDDDFRPGRFEWSIAIAWSVIALFDRGFMGAWATGLGLTWLLVAMGLVIVAHLAKRLLDDYEGDLVQSRQQARVWLAAALALLLLLDLGVDVLLGFDWKPSWFSMLQNAAVVLVGGWIAWRMLRADVGRITFRSATETDAPAQPAPSPGHVHARLHARLLKLMTVERIHRDPHLTFADFAARMDAPPPDVRRFVNHVLGARHFRAFLNRYRLEDARTALADPHQAQRKLMAIGHDAGFGSLASFTRVFREAEGMSPGEFRRRVGATPGQDPGSKRSEPASEP